VAQEAEIFDEIQALLGRVARGDAERQIERLEHEITEKQEERAKWFALLGLKQQLGPPGKAPTLRRAILLVLQDRPAGYRTKLAEVRGRLIERGWLTDSKSDAHRLQMMASDMTKRGQLERPSKGWYRLPSAPREEGDRQG
jgi:hypothetical protein